MTTHILLPGDAGAGNLIALARELEDRVVALHLGSPQQAADLATSGVDEVVTLACDDPAEGCAPVVAELLATAPGIVLAGRDAASRVLLGAAAAALDAPVFTDVTAVTSEGGTTRVTHGLCGGTATRVVAVGRGLRASEDLGLITDLAAALDAELGGTRPLAEGLNWLSRDRYIGISGQQIAPELYLAIGISGQLQHLAGARGSGTIVAINSDEHAPIAAEADYLLVGDLYQVVPELISALRSPS